MSLIKSSVRYLLNKSVNRQRFNDSIVYGTYLAIRFPQYAQTRKAELQFYQQALEGPARLIFDVGAHEGAKTAIFTKLASKVVSIEPSSFAIAILKQRFAHNGKVTIVAKGVGSRDGAAELTVFDDSTAYNTFSSKWAEALDGATPSRPNNAVRCVVEVPMTTLDSLIELYGAPNYIKVDVEGYELQVIKGLSRPVPLLSVECNLPEFRDETKEIIRVLSKLSSRAVYNFAISEPPLAFGSATWLAPDEMRRVVDSGKYAFLELFFRDRAAMS